MGKYDDILERLAKADGPSAQLDMAITELFQDPGDYGDGERGQPYTASLDVAITLVERLLPGERIDLAVAKGMHAAMISATILRTGTHSNSPAIALLIALFRALQAQDRE